jgi:adenylate kinase
VSCEPLPAARQRSFRLILLGPPGVGKGTQAEMLCERFRTCHLSTGDLFRAAACDPQPSPAMSAALEAMRRGELVSDEIVMDMVRERNQCLRCRGGFLLDGVPRTVPQAEHLDGLLGELNVEVDAVVLYEMPLEAIVERIGGRRTCRDCKAVFHVKGRPPANEGICDHCDGKLVQRDDDRPEAVRVRMKAYHEATSPVADFYEQRDQLVCISAEGRPDEILQRTLGSLESKLGIEVG